MRVPEALLFVVSTASHASNCRCFGSRGAHVPPTSGPQRTERPSVVGGASRVNRRSQPNGGNYLAGLLGRVIHRRRILRRILMPDR
jgi:hypothetical protein